MHLEYSRVIEHRPLGEAYRLLTMRASAIAAEVRPGQFIHLRVPQLDGSVLRRPFSVFQAEGEDLSVVYKCVGRGTRVMVGLERGDEVSLIGPLGNGFPLDRLAGVPILVAGGYGIAALYMVAQHLRERGVLFAGGARAGEIICVDDFGALGWPVRITTEDGSWGERGRVTDALDRWLAHERGDRHPEFFACGPMGMLEAVGARAVAGGWTAWLSLDRHMGCGVGACLACVQRVRRRVSAAADAPVADTWARVCRDGPVFECREVVWEGGRAAGDGP